MSAKRGTAKDVAAKRAHKKPKEPTLAELAGQINSGHKKARQAEWKGLPAAVDVGLLLLGAKGRVAHGGWEAWVKEHCTFGIRESQRYILTAEKVHELKSLQTGDEKLSLRAALARLRAPTTRPDSCGQTSFTREDLEKARQAPTPELEPGSHELKFVADEAARLLKRFQKRASKAEPNATNGSVDGRALMLLRLLNHLRNELEAERVVRALSEPDR